MEKYDVIIVGAGIAGINTAYQLKKKQKDLKILMLEKAEKIGGRVQSINLHHNQSYESGSVRFYPSHRHLLKLLREFKLGPSDWYHIPKDFPIDYVFTKKSLQLADKAEDLYHLLLEPENVNLYSESQQLKITLEEYAVQILGKKKLEYLKVLNSFPHIFLTSMKNGLQLLQRDFLEVPEFYILKKMTLTDILYSMLEKIQKKNNFTLQLNESFQSYQVKKGTYKIEVSTGKNKYLEKKLVLAIPQLDLKKVKEIPKTLSNSVFPVPLCRMFAIYPENNHWFQDIKATYTNGPIQRIYLKTGRLIQISYTSADRSEYWHRLSSDQVKLKNQLQKELKKMFPQKKIGHPDLLNVHYYPNGIHLWKLKVKGEEITEKIIQPDQKLPVYVCTEAYSKQQRWMEVALDMSYRVVKLLSP